MSLYLDKTLLELGMGTPFPYLFSVFTDPSCEFTKGKNLALVISMSLASDKQIEIE